MKKRIGLIFSILLFALVGLTACGSPYKNMKFSLSSEANLDETIELFINNDVDAEGKDLYGSVVVDAVVSGVGKKLSKDVVVPEFNQYLDIKTEKGKKGKTKITFTAKSEGETKIEISPAENPDGKYTKTLTFKVSIGVSSLRFKDDAVAAIAIGGSLDLNVSPKTYIDFAPGDTSQTGVKYTIDYPEGATRDYAKIIDNVLYTYDSDNYPVNGNGVKYVRLRATSEIYDDYYGAIPEQFSATYDIPVIDVAHEINVDSMYGAQKISLMKDNVGKYEVLLAAPLMNSTGTETIDKEMSTRVLNISLGEEGNATAKYKIGILGDANTINSSSPISLYPGETSDYYFSYNVSAKYKTSGYDVTFKLEYIGDDADNPEHDDTKFEGVFTKYITINFKVFVMPDVDNLYINGNTTNGQNYIIYDSYFATDNSNVSENGTPIKVQEKISTLPNLKYLISYDKGQLAEGISENGLIINGGSLGEGAVLNNNSTFYLKHNYASADILPNAGAKITVTFTYSLAPTYATSEAKQLYPKYEISKTINLEMKAGIKDIVLEDMGLKITEADDYHVLFEFPEGYDAEDTVDRIVGFKTDLIRVAYVDNQVLIRPNDNFETGTANICLVAKNGKQSNYIDIVVYLPILYQSNDTIKISMDESDDDIFVIGQYDSENKTYIPGKKSVEIETFTYETITNLILSEHSSIKFDL